jgi:lipopolysaccharide export LptBFGC system permease protein LptF
VSQTKICGVAVTWTISRYLVVEVAQYTALALLAATPVVLIPNLFDRAEEFLVVGITLADQLEIAVCVVPLLISYALPIAFLFGSMLAIGRMQGDLEVTALRANGLGPAALIVPMGLLGAIISALTAYLTIELEPRSKRELVALSLRLASRGNLIEAGRFQSFGDRTIFVQKRGADRRLEGVMISDSSSQQRSFRVFAETGEFRFDPESGLLRLSLENGDLRIEPALSDAFEAYRISFSRFDYNFPALQLGVGPLRYRVDELGLDALRDAIRRIESGDSGPDLRYRNPLIYSTQIQRMLAIPFSPLLFAFVGSSLGLRGVVRSRSRGVLLALGLFGGFYGLFAYAQDIAREGVVAPQLAIWAPNAILLVVGVALIFDARKLR